jgi:hypothetical protein
LRRPVCVKIGRLARPRCAAARTCRRPLQLLSSLAGSRARRPTDQQQKQRRSTRQPAAGRQRATATPSRQGCRRRPRRGMQERRAANEGLTSNSNSICPCRSDKRRLQINCGGIGQASMPMLQRSNTLAAWTIPRAARSRKATGYVPDRLWGGYGAEWLVIVEWRGQTEKPPGGKFEDDESSPPGGAFPILQPAGRGSEMTLRRHKLECQCN